MRFLTSSSAPKLSFDLGFVRDFSLFLSFAATTLGESSPLPAVSDVTSLGVAPSESVGRERCVGLAPFRLNIRGAASVIARDEMSVEDVGVLVVQ